MTDTPHRLRVLQVPGGMNRGGTETLLMNLFRHIDRSRVSFDFISYYREAGHFDAEIRQLGGRIITLLPPSQVGALQNIRTLYRIMRLHGPYDVLHAHTMFNSGLALLAGRLAGIPIRIAHSHATEIGGTVSSTERVYRGISRMLIARNATRFFACSANAGRFLFGERILKTAKYEFFANAVDFQPFLRETSLRRAVLNELGVPPDDLVIGHIGRFGKVKNHAFLLEVFAELQRGCPASTLLLVGDGADRGRYETLAAQRGISKHVRFLGVRQDIPRLMRAFDVFVLPSLVEGLGIVLLEAQVSGLHCLVSEHIQPEADMGLGLIHPLSLSCSPHMWTDALLALRGAPRPVRRTIEDAIAAGCFNLEMVVRRLCAVYGVKYG